VVVLRVILNPWCGRGTFRPCQLQQGRALPYCSFGEGPPHGSQTGSQTGSQITFAPAKERNHPGESASRQQRVKDSHLCKTVPGQQLTLRAILAQNSAETATGRISGETRSKFNCQLVVNRRLVRALATSHKGKSRVNAPVVQLNLTSLQDIHLGSVDLIQNTEFCTFLSSCLKRTEKQQQFAAGN
jgi:hypothetical protein